MYKEGDTVVAPEIWGAIKLCVYNVQMSSYRSYVSAYFYGKENTPVNRCTMPIEELKLISAENRPLKNIEHKKLLKMIPRGIIEARREFQIRINSKKY